MAIAMAMARAVWSMAALGCGLWLSGCASEGQSNPFDVQLPRDRAPSTPSTGNPPGATSTPPGTAPPNAPPSLDAPPPSTGPQSLGVFEAESLDLEGPYGGPVQSPFAGVALYANEDELSFEFTFPAVPGEYRIDVTGASDGSTAATAELLVEGTSRGMLAFEGTSPSVESVPLTLNTGAPLQQTLTLRPVNDDGSWDLFIDRIEIFRIGGATPPAVTPPNSSTPTTPTTPPPSTSGEGSVWETGVYRNLFVELGKSEAEVSARVEQVVDQLFYGSDEQRLYYELGSDEAYFYTADTDDVRSEGMSYAMMITVQLNMQPEFDRLWKFAKTRMQHESGDRTGYFAWRVRSDGTQLDQNPAPDGEEYFAMALLMASKRWGNGAGIYDYESEANHILNHMVNHQQLLGIAPGGIANMIDPVEKQIVFSVEGQSATFTDPSYHLPHFYELFARWAAQDNSLWLEVADESRQLFRDACHESTGLAPDYSHFDGTPTGGTHEQFRFDAWRVAMNIALDAYWWNKDPWQRDTWVKNYLGFFASQGVSTHLNQFNLDGTGAEGDHSPGLVAMNAVAALISEEDVAWEFVEEFWNTNPTTGNYRYYDGCLYLFGLLNVTGRYRIIGAD